MKGITIFISLLYFILLIAIINAQNNKNEIKSTDNAELNILSNLDFSDILNNSSLKSEIENLYYNRPSKAFTVVLMVYMALIIIGAVLVLVLVKPKIDN